MPPVHAVAVLKLMRRAAKQMRAHKGGLHIQYTQHVLKLVAHAVGAAGLIQPRAREHAARQRLIFHKSVQQPVAQLVARAHLHAGQQARVHSSESHGENFATRRSASILVGAQPSRKLRPARSPGATLTAALTQASASS